MAVYLIGFALSVLLIAYGEKKRLPVFLGISFFALLIPCLIAGLRAQNVGTDVMVYVKPLTNTAISAKNLQEYFDGYWFASWRNLYAQDYEIGFSLLVYVVAKLTHSLGAVLFAIQAIMIVPIYIALARDRKNIPVWLGMLMYYLLFYNTTLNAMRQWAAMAILLLAFRMLLERKWIWTAALCVVAVLFHNTAVLAIPIFVIFGVLQAVQNVRVDHNNLRLQASSVITGIIFLVAVVAILNLPLVLKLLSGIGLGQYSNYLEGEQMGLSLGQLVWQMPLLLVIVLNWKDLCRTDKAAPFYMATVLLTTVLSQLVSVDVNALRIASYFSVYCILWVPSVYRACRPGSKRILITLLMVGYGLVYWYYNYVLQMRNETIPYQFFIQ